MRYFIFALSILISACTLTIKSGEEHQSSSSQISSAVESSSSSSESSLSSTSSLSSQSSTIPASALLDVPFTPQAPYAQWDDARFQEGCEEASLLMVDRFYKEQDINAEEATQAIIAMTEWQEQNGMELDINAEQVARVAEEYLDYDVTLVTDKDVTADRIRQEIADGHPVIIPAQGQFLGNPYFSGGGPPYHMLVIIGYDEQGFITNDPGTKRGAEFRYNETTIMNAIHDWTGDKETVGSGRRVLIIVKP